MRQILLAVSIALISGALMAAEPTVGVLGDPARWAFTGDRTYDVADLRAALAGDFEVLLSSRPQASRERFLAVVAKALERGYRSKGYPDPQVTVTVAATEDRLLCDLAPGRRYVTGRIEIRGAKRIPVDALRDALTKDPPPGVTVPTPLPGHKTTATGQAIGDDALPYEGAFWIPGESASFTSFAQAFARQGVIDALRRMGWFEPIVEVAIRPEADGTATLIVDLIEEGPPAVLGDVDVLGLVRNSRGLVLDCLGLQVGQSLTAAIEADIARKLAETHRFVNSKVEIIPPPFGDGPCKLVVTVTEPLTVPRLGEPLTPLQQRMMRMAESVATLGDSDWEMRGHLGLPVSDDGPYTHYLEPRLRVSRADGLAVIDVAILDAEQNVVWNPKLLTDREQVVLLSGDGRSRLSFPQQGLLTTIKLNFSANEHRDGKDRLGFTYNFHCKWGQDLDSPPLALDVTMSPLAALILVCRETTFTVHDDEPETRLQGEHDTVLLDRETDQFREWRMDDFMAISCRPGRLRAAWPALQAEVDRAEDLAQHNRPAASVLRFFVREAQAACRALDVPPVPYLDLLEQVALGDVLDSLKEVAFPNDDEDRSSNRFKIPPTWSEGTTAPQWSNFLVKWFWGHYSVSLPRDTPLWVMGREAMLLGMRPKGSPPASPIQLATLLREAHAGPLHFAFAAATFGRLHPVYRIVLADAGLDVLDRGAYLREWEFLLDDASPVGKLARSTVIALRNADDADLARYTAPLGPAVQQAAIELRQRTDEPLRSVLHDLADRLWEPAARPALETLLRDWSR